MFSRSSVPGGNPSSRRQSLRPPSPGSDGSSVPLAQSRRGSKVLFDTKTPPSILRWEILNRVLALSVKGDWPAVDQHLNNLERNNMEISSTEIEVKMDILIQSVTKQHNTNRIRLMKHQLKLRLKNAYSSSQYWGSVFFLTKIYLLFLCRFSLNFLYLIVFKQEISRVFILNQLTAIELRTEAFFL